MRIIPEFFVGQYEIGEKMSDEEEGSGFGSERPMYDAVCSKCGQPCKVPFKPAEGRPVYCRNCYKPRRPRY